MRGEKKPVSYNARRLAGSPPHARGKVGEKGLEIFDKRITPACAGKRPTKKRINQPYEDHPRMRGEKPKKDPKL